MAQRKVSSGIRVELSSWFIFNKFSTFFLVLHLIVILCLVLMWLEAAWGTLSSLSRTSIRQDITWTSRARRWPTATTPTTLQALLMTARKCSHVLRRPPITPLIYHHYMFFKNPHDCLNNLLAALKIFQDSNTEPVEKSSPPASWDQTNKCPFGELKKKCTTINIFLCWCYFLEKRMCSFCLDTRTHSRTAERPESS